MAWWNRLFKKKEPIKKEPIKKKTTQKRPAEKKKALKRNIEPQFDEAELDKIVKEELKKQGVEYTFRIYGTEEKPLYHVFHVNMKEPAGAECNTQECEFFSQKGVG